MALQNQKVQGGHVVKILIGAEVVGMGRSSNTAEDFGVDGVYVLGDVAPQEHIPMRWSGTVTIDSFVLNANSLDAQTLQIFELIAAGHEELKQQARFNFTFLGRDDVELFTFLECTPMNFSMNFAANQFTGQNATFAPRGMRRGDTHQFRGDIAQGLGSELPA